jgi:plasmid stability protein
MVFLKVGLPDSLYRRLCVRAEVAGLSVETALKGLLDSSLRDLNPEKVKKLFPLAPAGESRTVPTSSGEAWRTKVSPERVQVILHSLDLGVGIKEIAARNGIGGSTVRRIAAARKHAQRVETSASRTARGVSP